GRLVFFQSLQIILEQKSVIRKRPDVAKCEFTHQRRRAFHAIRWAEGIRRLLRAPTARRETRRSSAATIRCSRLPGLPARSPRRSTRPLHRRQTTPCRYPEDHRSNSSEFPAPTQFPPTACCSSCSDFRRPAPRPRPRESL